MMRTTFSLVLVSLLAAGCGNNAAEEAKKAQEAKAAAEEKQKMEEALAKRKAEREAKAKAEEDAEKAVAEAVDKVAVLPETMPKDVVKACDAVAEAQDEFMKRHYEGEALKKWESAKGTQLPMTKVQCTQADSVEVAACQKNALDNAPTELRKKLPELLKACIEKFGKAGAPPPTAAIPKPKPKG